MAQRILDSHVHLWGSWAANPHHHAWMTPGSRLAKRYSVAEYAAATSAPARGGGGGGGGGGGPAPPCTPAGFVFVETAPRVDAAPSGRTAADAPRPEAYAARALDEARFLRRLVEGAPAPGDGFGPAASPATGGAAPPPPPLVGIVPWAPLDRGAAAFRAYVAAARGAAGEAAWARVVGFRFLVQGMGRPELGALADSAEAVEVLREFGGRWCFDVGVDVRQGGEWQAEMMEGLVGRVRRAGGEVTFVLSECLRDS
jgi:L-rhamnono-1,4-lactonase